MSFDGPDCLLAIFQHLKDMPLGFQIRVGKQ